MIVNILERMSMSLDAVSSFSTIKYLNMSFEISFILNSSHWELTIPAWETKSSFFCLIIFKHHVGKRLSHSPKILDNVLIVPSKEISSGFLGSISFVYFVFSWESNFWSNNVTFSSSDQSRHLFEKIVSYLLKYAGNITPLSWDHNEILREGVWNPLRWGDSWCSFLCFLICLQFLKFFKLFELSVLHLF